MDHKSNRGGEGRTTSPHSEDRSGSGSDSRRTSGRSSHGIEPDLRGQDQPKDKSRAQQPGTPEAPRTAGEKAQRDAARQPLSPGEPAGHE
jgi:hypothetical protein